MGLLIKLIVEILDLKSGAMAHQTKIKLSNTSLDILRKGRILSEDETFEDMLTRVAKTLSVSTDSKNRKSKDLKLEKRLYGLMKQRYIVYSTPILTNAGRFKDKPLSACTAPAGINFSDLARVRKIVHDTHQSGMGTGYCLDEYDNPIQVLMYLNNFAIESAESGKEDRPVGNMATLSIYHPEIESFIDYKSRNLENIKWKFNLAINVDRDFLDAAKYGKTYKLKNKRRISARKILNKIAKNNFVCGDPGLLFIDNLNKSNPASFLGEYKTVAPCGEVGLLPGEACQFGYLNLCRFAKRDNSIDWKMLSVATSALVKSLDNALEVTVNNIADEKSKDLILQKRKIGIGICGLSELFIKLAIPYDSAKARNLARNIMAFVNYNSKLASHKLALKKGSCKAMDHIECGYRNGYLFKYAKNSEMVTKKMWVKLHDDIQKSLKLRNITTTALPPTGRSALVIDSSTGIEPAFSIYDYEGNLRKDLIKALKKFGLTDILSENPLNIVEKLPKRIKSVYKTALQIPVDKHLKMVSYVQEYVDESISKTINLPEDCRVEQIVEAIYMAFDIGLKGISVYRANSRKMQPKSL